MNTVSSCISPISPAEVPLTTPKRAAAHVHIPALDGLRGLAIILVLVFHFILPDHHAERWRALFLHVAGIGWIGVDLFFVLSGFLITSILLEAKDTQGYFRNFYMRRVLRIFPLYYGVLAATLLFSLVTPLHIRNQWALWAYLSNYFPARGSGFIQFWSLAVEEQFYLVWPALVFLLNRRALLGVCGLMMVIALACRIWRIHMGLDPELTYFATYCRMDTLAVGGMLALLARGKQGIAGLATPAKIAMGTCGVALVGLFAWNRAYFGYGDPRVQSIGYTLLGFFFGGVLTWTILAPRNSLTGRIFNGVGLRFFGKYSYGIYVIHGLVHPWLDDVFPARGMPGNHMLYFAAQFGRMALGTVISVVLALLTWHLFEKHFLKLKRFFEYRAPTLSEPVRDALIPPEVAASGGTARLSQGT